MGDQTRISKRRQLAALVKETYGSPGQIVGILIAAISLFNLVHAAWTLPLADFLAQLLQAYRSVFHRPIQWLLSWLPWRFPGWTRDVMILWALLGGTAARWLIGRNLAQGPVFRFQKTADFFHRIYTVAVAVLLGPILVACFLLADDSHFILRKLGISVVHKVRFPAIRLLMQLKDPYTRWHDALVLLLLIMATIVGCGTLVAVNGFF
jgi:hypothetical protein